MCSIGDAASSLYKEHRGVAFGLGLMPRVLTAGLAP